MQEVIIKKDSKIVLNKETNMFLNPKFVFLPVEEGFKLKVADNEYVYKNDIVAMNDKGRSITATASGRVLGLKKMDYYDKKDVPSVVIENDFKENIRAKKSAKKYITDYSKKEFLRVLEDTSYRYKGVYLADKFAGVAKEIIINAVEPDPYFGSKRVILKEAGEDILETCDFLGTMLEAEKIYFVLKNTDGEEISRLTSMIGTYPNIELKLVNEAYPNGIGYMQKKILKLPDALVIDLEEVADVFRLLKRERPISSKFITITGSAVHPRAVVRVKLGCLLSEVFVQNFDFTSPKIDVYLNGSLYGKRVDSLKYVVDSQIDGIFIDEEQKYEVSPCLNCGQCSKTCPVGLNPKFVFDHDGKVMPEYYDKCLQCGLCNYVCPANRDLRAFMKGSEL